MRIRKFVVRKSIREEIEEQEITKKKMEKQIAKVAKERADEKELLTELMKFFNESDAKHYMRMLKPFDINSLDMIVGVWTYNTDEQLIKGFKGHYIGPKMVARIRKFVESIS